MNHVKTEFEEKTKHINLYFDLLRSIVDCNAVLLFTDSTTKNLDSDLKKVMKANAFLLLYNILESTIRKSLESMHNSINSSNLQFKDAVDEIKEIWIEFKYSNFKKNDHTPKRILATLTTIITDVIDIEYETFIKKRKSNDISGNVDARKVRALCEKYKLDKNTRVLGTNLIRITSRRNSLAHGNESFAEAGKDFTYSDLNKLKRETILFLREFILKTEKYIYTKQFQI